MAPAFACQKRDKWGKRVRKTARVRLRLTYRCCGMEWDDEYALVFSMECPDCDAMIAPHDIADIAPRKRPAKLKPGRKR